MFHQSNAQARIQILNMIQILTIPFPSSNIIHTIITLFILRFLTDRPWHSFCDDTFSAFQFIIHYRSNPEFNQLNEDISLDKLWSKIGLEHVNLDPLWTRQLDPYRNAYTEHVVVVLS